MKKILLIDDNKTILETLELTLTSNIDDIEVICVDSFTLASTTIRKNRDDIFMAVVDLHLADCKPGQAVSLTLSHKIPTIVLTSDVDENLKELFLKKDVLEYILKDSLGSIKSAVNFIKKIIRNYSSTVLIVDDSKLYRTVLREDLEKLHLNVLEACDGQEALDVLNETEEKISLVLTDYYMPEVDGIELTMRLREDYEKDTLSIIALSASEDEHALSEFIKAGANDFLAKPHTFEGLSVRINSNLDVLDLFQTTKDLSNKDYLTGSYNRRYFFDASEAIVGKNARKDESIVVATLDIDKFKNINDTYGHDVGDAAIKQIASLLKQTLRRTDLVARFGGEEYCILLEDISFEDAQKLFEKIRATFEANIITIKDITIQYTVSLGVAYGKSSDIYEMLKVSDNALYEAKNTGRNKVIIHTIGQA
ncbi:diguanylate cyclase [Sulfurimonas aquatica]|uniref:diguanylate cyclase n=1 Tax=Sulfurimonas aquatica TaxID=2672570 RepID=A0A975AY40_9BACT|nr:diguanylate cyclase [Sulfurimonas aquatica]QSZ40722.1 diguanylate cyclase [Sulfurimonas aquatica]